jgi:hypothetical protein
MIDWSRYAVGGAAAREDSFTGLRPEMQDRVAAMLQAAEQELGPGALRITSAYRSPELQAQLYAGALERYGSEEEARRWVAPPGRSQHNFGTAVDFANADGGLLRDPSSREAQWLRENAARFGLAVPMDWEPWQVELEGARNQPLPASYDDFQLPDQTSPLAPPAPQAGEMQGMASGYQPPRDVNDLYTEREQIDPLSFYNPFEIAERFRLQ